MRYAFRQPEGAFAIIYFITALFAIGWLIAFIGGIMLLIAAFKQGIGWGLAVIFLPFAALIFVCVHWYDAKRPISIQLAGVLIGLTALWIGVRHGTRTAQGGSWMSEMADRGALEALAHSAKTEIRYEGVAASARPERARRDAEPVELPEGITDPWQLAGKTLSEVDQMLGRPRMRLEKGDTIVLNYAGFTLTSDDGRVVTWVDVEEDESDAP